MKTLQRTTPRKPLQKTNNRWKWMAGAAASAAAATAAQAQTTITLGGFVNSAGFNSLSPDLWAPHQLGVMQIVGWGGLLDTSSGMPKRPFGAAIGSAKFGYPQKLRHGPLTWGDGAMRMSAFRTAVTFGTSQNKPVSTWVDVIRSNPANGHPTKTIADGSYPRTKTFVTLKGTLACSMEGNPSVNNGALTSGTLQLTGSAGPSGASITEDSFTFMPVPEPSSLAMLALGATGLLALRARRKAA